MSSQLKAREKAKASLGRIELPLLAPGASALSIELQGLALTATACLGGYFTTTLRRCL